MPQDPLSCLGCEYNAADQEFNQNGLDFPSELFTGSIDRLVGHKRLQRLGEGKDTGGKPKSYIDSSSTVRRRGVLYKRGGL